MKLKRTAVVALVLLVLVLLLPTACQEVPSDLQQDLKSEGENYTDSIEGDDGNLYRVILDNKVYVLEGRVLGNLESHTETEAYLSGATVDGTGGVSGRMWQSGKGILPIEILSLSPSFPGIEAGDSILIKTTDLKIMALPEGSTTTFVCNRDTEVIAPPSGRGEHFTRERIVYELDYCRMESPRYLRSD